VCGRRPRRRVTGRVARRRTKVSATQQIRRTVEEISLAMREAGPGQYADRTRGLIAILWRAGLRISKALALTETDLEPKTGSVLVRAGKGGKRRIVRMDDWAWEHVGRWAEHRIQLPVGPLFCTLAGPTRGRAWSATAARGEPRRLAALAGLRRRFAPHQLRHAHAIEMARDPVADHPEAARACAPRHHVDLPPRNRHARDRRHGPSPPTARDPSERRPPAVTTYRTARDRRIARSSPSRDPRSQPRVREPYP